MAFVLRFIVVFRRVGIRIWSGFILVVVGFGWVLGFYFRGLGEKIGLNF